MNEPTNAILIGFDNYLMDDVGHVANNNYDNDVYNDQTYCYGNLLQQIITRIFFLQ